MEEKNISQVPVNTNNSYINNTSVVEPVGGKSSSRKALFACIGGVIGFAVGGLGVFVIMQLLQKPDTSSTACECPECQTSDNVSLDFDFLKLEQSDSNIIYSPLSIRNGLALLSAGAGGTTAAEIDNVLGDVKIPKYQNVADTMSLANAVFIRDNYSDKVLPNYVSTVEQNYNAEVLYDSFTGSVNMDNWVSQKTFGLINNIGIQTNDDLKMVLANALAIQMDWQYAFDADNTRGEPFYQVDGSEMFVTTMKKETSASAIKYYIDNDATMLTMPLKPVSDASLEFVAVMPKGDIGNYVENVSVDDIESMLSSATSASEPKDGVVINIPKFKFDYELDFKADLQALGVVSAFNQMNANFSKIASEPLYVSDAVHKANIDFSEDGIKAAAVTAFGMEVGAMELEEEPQPVIIDIDHPFLFLVRDADNGTIWFVGTVCQPNSWADDADEYHR